jgi:hypothetical protein
MNDTDNKFMIEAIDIADPNQVRQIFKSVRLILSGSSQFG